MKLKSQTIRLSQPSNSALVAALVLAATVPYLNMLLNGFVYDDLTQVLNNPYLVSFHHLRQIFTTGAWSYRGQEGVTNYYRPLMTFGYLLCYHLFGKIAFGYHLVSLLLNALVVLSLCGLTLALFRRRSIAFLAALAFALHPVHTESVSWIAGVTDVEVTLFCVLTFWLFVKCAQPEGRRSEKMMAGMAACFVLALLSKEQALVLPILATIYEHGYRDDRAKTTQPQKLARYGMLWLLSAAYLLLRIRLLGALAPVNHAARLTWREAFLSAPALVAHYVAKVVWPWRLCAFYVFHKSARLLDPRVMAGIAALALLAGLFAVWWRRDRLVSFGILWFLATLAPVLNARWMAANVFAERYLYLPSIGLCWIFAWCVVKLWEQMRASRKIWRLALASGLALLLVAAALRIVTRNRDWSDGVELYTRTLSQQPDAAPILNNLGAIYWNRGQASQAAAEWAAAVKSQPTLVPALDNLGLYYARNGNYSRAVDYERQAARLNPAYAPAHLHLALADEQLGLRQPAEQQLRAAVFLSPLNSEARNKLAELYSETGRPAEAERQFKASVDSQPNLEALNGLGRIYLRAGRRSEASIAFQHALALDPFDSVAHFSLGAIDAAAGKNDLAVKEYRAGLETDPRNADALAALERLRVQDAHAKKSGR